MGQPLSYVLPIPIGLSQYAESIRTITFGKCQTSPYVGNELWFVNIPAGRNQSPENVGKYLKADGYDPWEDELPAEDHTFFVTEAYASPYYFNRFRRDVEAWKKVAKTFVIGQWDPRYEVLWSEMPKFRHTLLDGKVVKYGYCRSQSAAYPDRELWYISLPDGHAFIVDRECTAPEFLDSVGSNYLRWIPICWCHPGPDGYEEDALRNIRFCLDSPFVPPDIHYVEKMDEKDIRKIRELTWWDRKFGKKLHPWWVIAASSGYRKLDE